MEQLIVHLLGDYVTQTNWMAQNKTKDWFAAWLHALVYGAGFLLLSPSLAALTVIVLTHYLIDRYRLATYVVFAKNWITQPSLRWKEATRNAGYPNTVPAWLAVWLTIIADNTMHLAINYAALRWL